MFRGGRRHQAHGSTPAWTTAVLLLLAQLSALSVPGQGNTEQQANSVAVASPQDFFKAVANPFIISISVTQDLQLEESLWPVGVTPLMRNLTIQGVAGPREHRLINFTSATRKLSVEPGGQLLFHNLVIVLAGTSGGSYMAFIVPSPGAVVWVRSCIWKSPICASARKVLAILGTQPRPVEFPGWQRLRPATWPLCFRGRCYRHVFNVADFSTSTPLISSSQDDPGAYTALFTDAIWLCDVSFSDTCVARQGYEACRNEAMRMHGSGFVHAYSSRAYTAFMVLAALVCLASTGGASWAASWQMRRWKAGRASEEAWGDDGRGSMDAAGITDSSALVGDGSTGGPQQQVFRGHYVGQGSRDNVALGPFLGAGSFGRVYQGSWQDLLVAVKIIPHDKQAACSIVSEVALSMALVHVNVVRTYHHFMLVDDNGVITAAASSAAFSPPSPLERPSQQESPESSRFTQFTRYPGQTGAAFMVEQVEEQRQTWIIQELSDLGPLSTHLRNLKMRCADGQLDVGLVLGYAVDIARGMAYLHEHNICHGDLKAGNTLVMSNPAAPGGPGTAKVADFGMSRVLINSTHLSTHTIGTITHMPPELLLDGQLTRECDLYSYGILMWEVATGESLYPKMNPVQVMNKVLLEKQRPVFPPHVPEEFVNLAQECWSHQVAARPAFAEVVARLLAMVKRWDRRVGAAQKKMMLSSAASSARSLHLDRQSSQPSTPLSPDKAPHDNLSHLLPTPQGAPPAVPPAAATLPRLVPALALLGRGSPLRIGRGPADDAPPGRSGEGQKVKQRRETPDRTPGGSPCGTSPRTLLRAPDVPHLPPLGDPAGGISAAVPPCEAVGAEARHPPPLEPEAVSSALPAEALHQEPGVQEGPLRLPSSTTAGLLQGQGGS